MIKYTDTEIVFEEIPDEVTLAINITNCPNHCPGCHSPYLRENIGKELYGEDLVNMINSNYGITCVLFMGEGKDEEWLFQLVDCLRATYKHNIKIGLYTGSENVSEFLWENLDYIKLGPYVEELGPLNKETTNQRLYKYDREGKVPGMRGLKIGGKYRTNWVDITYRFWDRNKE